MTFVVKEVEACLNVSLKRRTIKRTKYEGEDVHFCEPGQGLILSEDDDVEEMTVTESPMVYI